MSRSDMHIRAGFAKIARKLRRFIRRDPPGHPQHDGFSVEQNRFPLSEKTGPVILQGRLLDVFLIAPATANVIAKMAAGIADDMLTTTVLAARCPKIVGCPAFVSAQSASPHPVF